MVFNEQLYKNRGRVYFHGTPYETLDKSNGRFGCFFLTTDFSYAVDYSKKEEKGIFGNVFEFHLRSPMNIFNIKSTMDRYKLQKIVSKELYELANLSNWLVNSKDIASRKDLINAIKSLGYDGFFDSEVDDDKIYKNPTIGIFSLDNLDFIKTYVFDDFKLNKQFKERYDWELKNLCTKCMLLYKSGIKDKDLLIDILYLDKTKTLLRQEIADYVKGVDLKKFEEFNVEVKFNQIGEPYYLQGGRIREQILDTERFLKLKEMGYFGGIK